MTLTALVDLYGNSRVNLTPKAKTQITVAVKQLELHLGSSLSAADLCAPVIVAHMKHLLQCRKSPATVNRRRGHLRTLWKFACEEGFNDHDYWKGKIPKAREFKRRPVAWSTEDLGSMLSQADRVSPKRLGGMQSMHWKALILILYYTGFRISAVLSLRRQDLRGRILMIPPEMQKDDEEQFVQLPTDLVNMLVALPRPQRLVDGRALSEMLIPWPWRTDYAQKAFYRYILKPAQLPNDRRLKFHAIRRTVATIVAATKGKEAAREIMGHSSISITERYLADPAMVDPSLQGALHPMDVLPRLGNAG